MEQVVVVGASLAGLRAAEQLRRRKYAGRLVLIGAEPTLPYDRPPLSKEVLRGELEPDAIGLRRRPYEELDLDLRLGARAVGLDPAAGRVELDGAAPVAYDGLVIATGSRVRTLPRQPALEGVFTLRTVQDALALRAALQAGPRVVVIGAGFIGAEVAASCRQLGLDVTLVEALEAPLAKSLGAELGRRLAAVHEAQGVTVRCGAGVAAIEGRGGRVERVALDDGASLDADVVVVGIGVVPNVEWLDGSGLDVGDGVECDETCRASAPNVVAAGDVARWYNPLFDERMRIEHWTHATEQGKHAAQTLLLGPDEAQPFAPAPLFWSDQYTLKIQGAGRFRATDTRHVCHGGLDDDRFCVLYGRDDRLVGVLTFDLPAKAIAYRAMITRRASWAEALEAATD
ncbi:MAG: NAD(P)/FAD-dependent oxidoreductase [Myxococcales bacterium]|nr:NAD(P)/FAD-dependent oxidoreductase [Myxococcales bacterium]